MNTLTRVVGACGLLLAASPGVQGRQPPERAPDVEPTPCALGETPAYIPRLLRVIVNASDSRSEFVFLQRPCGALLARVIDLKALRIRHEGQPSVTIDDEAYISLNGYDGLTYRLLAAEQRLLIDGEPWVFHPTVLDLEPALASTPQEAPMGGFINYGLFTAGTAGSDDRTLSGSAGVGVFGGPHVLLSDWVLQRSAGVQEVYRLDTTLVRDFPEHTATLRIGDVFTRGGSYGGGAPVGGIQYGTNFATRPFLSITPVQMLEASTRQTAGVDLYINPQDPERASRAVFLGSLTTVPHGPVELINVPTYNNGEYQLLLRDALGREVMVRQPFFFNAGLLRAGLHDFSYELGLQRQGFGGDAYDGALLSGTHRYGISNALTGEAHVAATERGGVLGLTGLVAVPHLGVVGVTAAGTHAADGAPGALGSLSIENRYESHAYALRQDCQTEHFVLPNESGPPSSIICRTALGLSGALPWGASLGLTAATTRARGGADVRNLRLGYTTRPWPGAHVTAYAGWTGGEEEDVSAGVLFSTTLAPLSRAGWGRVAGLDARRTQFSASALGDETGVTRGQGRLSTGGRLGDSAVGVQASSSFAGPEQQSLTLNAAAPVVNTVAGVQSTDGQDSYAAGATGAVAFLDGRWKMSRPLYSSFALVRLGPENAGVRVNGLRADDQGDVLVSPLQAYAENSVQVNGADLPMSVRFSSLSEAVTPRWRSGVVVKPRIEHVRDAMVTVLVRDIGGNTVPLPSGAYATRPGSEERFPTGDEGAIYLAGLEPRSTITVTYRGETCMLALQLPEVQERDIIPELGPYLCEGIQP